MENQKKSSVPSLPKGSSLGSMAGKAPKMPDHIAALIKEHHEKSHLDENGQWKDHLKKKGIEYIKKKK